MRSTSAICQTRTPTCNRCKRCRQIRTKPLRWMLVKPTILTLSTSGNWCNFKNKWTLKKTKELQSWRNLTWFKPLRKEIVNLKRRPTKNMFLQCRNSLRWRSVYLSPQKTTIPIKMKKITLKSKKQRLCHRRVFITRQVISSTLDLKRRLMFNQRNWSQATTESHKRRHL